jgi:hypothetical protein
MTKRCLVLALIAPIAGCSFYFGGDDTGDDCGSGDAEYPGDPGPGLRNPDNGQCEYYGGGGGCEYPPYDTAGFDESGAAYEPDWASCSSGCEGLDEATCLAAPQCRGTYLDSCGSDSSSDCAPDLYFNECWGVAPTGPVTGECYGLDAYGCSQHNDCAAVYVRNSSGYLSFVTCQPETIQGCYSDEECPTGYECTADTDCLPPPMGESDSPVCYGQCVPSQNACDNVDCGIGYHCEEECYPCDDADGDGMCEPICQPVCVPDYTTCSAVDCGPGYHCEELCHPCDPLPDGTGCEDGPYCEPQCVPDVPPTCDLVDCGPDAHCELQCYPPDPTDPTDPPTMDECYPVCVPNDPGNTCDEIVCPPGAHCEESCVVAPCLPDGECPPPYCYGECVPDGPTETCESLQTEAECTGRPDCVAVYTGDDCVCYPWGCECAVLTYERCETGWVIDPDPMGRSSPLPRILARP